MLSHCQCEPLEHLLVESDRSVRLCSPMMLHFHVLICHAERSSSPLDAVIAGKNDATTTVDYVLLERCSKSGVLHANVR